MKRVLGLLLALAAVLPLAAQDSFNAMSLNGSTGIYVVPTARIGFPDDNMGFNVGYHANYFDPPGGGGKLNHLIQANFSFLKMFEISGTFDIQPKESAWYHGYRDDSTNDILTGIKFQLPFGSIPIAVGSSIQYHDLGRDGGDHLAVQFYGAITYDSEIFGWPSETSIALGYTYLEGESHRNIDYGMAFDLIAFPKQLGKFLHFLIDFANFSYSAAPWGADAWTRGVLNSGIRVDLSQIPVFKKFNFVVDAYIADAFDASKYGGRSIGLGAMFGMSF